MSKGVLIALISTADGIHQDIRQIKPEYVETLGDAIESTISTYLEHYNNTYGNNCRIIKIELHFSTE